MEFSTLRNKIVFLKPKNDEENSMEEIQTKWYPYNPIKNEFFNDLFVYQNNSTENEQKFKQIINAYGFWAKVAPMTGKEYAEAQIIREETTYKIITRHFSGIESKMKVYTDYGILDVVSVLDVDGRREQLQIVCKEVI